MVKQKSAIANRSPIGGEGDSRRGLTDLRRQPEGANRFFRHSKQNNTQRPGRISTPLPGRGGGGFWLEGAFLETT